MPERSSVGSKVAAEHRELDALFAETLAALKAEDGKSAARDSFDLLREAFEAHFCQEDHLYYPAIWALRPELEEPLRAFVRAHDQFRTRLHELDSRLQGAQETKLEKDLSEFSTAFAKHEREEESLLRRLDEELRAPR